MSLDISLSVSPHFLAWLDASQVSLAFTTYQSNRLFLLGLKNKETLSTFERLFDRPMGLSVHEGRLYMSTRTQIWQLSNALPAGTSHEGYDALYVPRQSHVTGDLDVHDVAIDKDGRIVFVNTLYSCLATASEQHSFELLWQPPFISQLVAEDRCHLNGLAMDEGVARYMTAVSRSDVASGWRARRQNGGCLIDLQSNQILLNELSMPHSPRVHEKQLWLLNSGAGEVGYFDPSRNAFEPVLFCPGYLRGMAIYKHFAIVGLSKPRYNKAFSGLPLQSQDAEPVCGLYVIDLRRGELAHWVQIEGIVTELYDVAVLPGVRCPQALGFKSDEIERFISFQVGKEVYTSQLPPNRSDAAQEAQTSRQEFALPPATKVKAPVPHRQVSSKRLTLPAQYRFQVSFDMSVEAAIRHFNALTYPNLQQEVQRKRFYEPLVAVLAFLPPMLGGERGGRQAVGMVLAEYRRPLLRGEWRNGEGLSVAPSPTRPLAPSQKGGLLSSLFVLPRHREKGVAKGLLYHLERALAQKQIATLDWSYRTDWKTCPIIENLMEQYGWLPAQTSLYQYRVDAKKLLASKPFAHAKLAAGLSIFPWREISRQERAAILARQQTETSYSPTLDPFQLEDRQAAGSVGLRRGDTIVGWMICHHSQRDTIQYTALFLSPEERNQLRTIHGKVIPLIKAAVEWQVQQDIPRIIFQVEADNQTMLKFTKRYLAVAMLKSSEVRISQKRLVS